MKPMNPYVGFLTLIGTLIFGASMYSYRNSGSFLFVEVISVISLFAYGLERSGV